MRFTRRGQERRGQVEHVQAMLSREMREARKEREKGRTCARLHRVLNTSSRLQRLYITAKSKSDISIKPGSPA
jgi:hypothetical protein